MEIMIIGGVICAIISAVMAENRGRSKGGWAVLGLLFGVFAILVLAIMGKAPVAVKADV